MKFFLDVILPKNPLGYLFGTDTDLMLTITVILFAIAVTVAAVVLILKAVTENKKPRSAAPADKSSGAEQNGKEDGNGAENPESGKNGGDKNG